MSLFNRKVLQIGVVAKSYIIAKILHSEYWQHIGGKKRGQYGVNI